MKLSIDFPDTFGELPDHITSGLLLWQEVVHPIFEPASSCVINCIHANRVFNSGSIVTIPKPLKYQMGTEKG